MQFYSFEIVIEQVHDEEGYLAYSPQLPGCFSNGRTLEETRLNIREAIQQHIAAMQAHGQPILRHWTVLMPGAQPPGLA